MRLTNKCPTRSLAILRFALPAQVVKLVDTLASGASARKGVEVQVLSWAPKFLPTLRVRRHLAHRSFCVERTMPATRLLYPMLGACISWIAAVESKK
jgi:hypothetical protein